jgi:glycosyltransferase involved in cell wall biosynthesis
MSSPEISVIITTYNRPNLLHRAISSVVNQTYGDIECIVVDDCSSTIESKRVTESFDDSRVRYIRHDSNQGLSTARNTGISHSTGTYIAFLDDDDKWQENKLLKQVQKFRKLSDDYALVYCWMNYRSDKDGQILRQYRPRLKGDIFMKTITGQPITAGSTLMCRQSVAAEIKFDTSLDRGIDGDFIRRVCESYHVEYVPEILVDYYVEHGNNRITSNDRDSLMDAIEGHKSKLAKFDNKLKQHPEKAAIIHQKIAHRYAQCGRLTQSISHHAQAIKLRTGSLETYKSILDSVRCYIRGFLK